MKLEDYSKYYIQGSDHYLIPKDDLAELVEENQELKQQLDKYENEPLTNKISRIDSIVSNIYSQNKTQQKEFIKYLEDEMLSVKERIDYIESRKVLNNTPEKYVSIGYLAALEEILQKYKKIIGDDNNV